jgi:uncharacterized membrane protein YvbJ
MKKCMICGWDEHDDSRFTCPACGEATWSGQTAEVRRDAEAEAAAEPETILITSEMNGDVVEVPLGPKKRGPGRPRKTQ